MTVKLRNNAINSAYKIILHRRKEAGLGNSYNSFEFYDNVCRFFVFQLD